MQRTLFYSALLACIGFSACSSSKYSKTKKLPGTWQAQPITIDGDSKDWPAPYPEYNSKASLGYAVSNDKDNLYITVETGDQATQLKILRNGLTVWIDKTGDKEQVTAINYPLPRNYNRGAKNDRDGSDTRPSSGYWQQGQGNNPRQRANMEDRIKKLLEGANEYSLQGFRSCNAQFPLMQKDSCGIVVRIGLDETNELVWEAVIPFKSFFHKAQIDRRDKGKPMSICIETTGSDRPAGQGGGRGGNGGGGMRPGMRVGMGGMGMRMGGGGMGGGMGSRGGGGQSDAAMEGLYKSTQTWKKFGIAWQD
jgi:hypothetical protein